MTTGNTREALNKAYQFKGDRTSNDWIKLQSLGIEANPSALLDAMAEDGMLRVVVWCPNRLLNHADELLASKCSDRIQHVTRYEVVPPEPPHVHEWKVTVVMSAVPPEFVRIRCKCGGVYEVSSTLPIEVPL